MKKFAYNETLKLWNTESLTSDLREHGANHDLKGEALDAFVKANLATVETVANTWGWMWVSEPTIWHVCDHARKGDGYVNFFSLYTLAKEIADKSISYLNKTGLLPLPYDKLNAKRFLNILRYPKRMPLTLATWLVKEAKEKFFYSMDYCSNYKDHPDAYVPAYSRQYGWVMENYRELIHTWLDEILPPVSFFNEAVDPFEFSPGAVADACTNPICKWFRAEHSYANSMPALILEPDPVAHRNPIEEFYRPETTVRFKEVSIDPVGAENPKRIEAVESVARTTRYTIADVYSVRPLTVPKQINAVRVVCPESAYFARLQNHIDKQLRKWWERHGLLEVFVHGDQDISRAKARFGSAHADTYATTDLSSASDTVHRDFLYSIEHPTLNYLMGFMPQVVVWGKTMRWLDMFGTMGSPLTFDVEMITFYILVRLAMVLQDYGNSTDTAKLPARKACVYLVGDDIVCLAKYYDTLLGLLDYFHFIPNPDKSFGHGHVREACGKEFVDGTEITSVYYPRGLVIDDCINQARWDGYREKYDAPLVSLISHHRDLLGVCPEAAASVLDVIKGEFDLGFGLDSTSTWNDTITGNSLYRLENQDGVARNSVILDIQPNEYVMLYSPVVRWEPCEPKRQCWCNDVPKSVFDMLEAEWRMYNHDAYIFEYFKNDNCVAGHTISLPKATHAHMRPVVELRLTRHS